MLASHKININDIIVEFPFDPYAIQKEYMSKVIECLQTGTNAVLESPTGTGKTLSLLCSSLAWLTMEKEKTKKDQEENQQLLTGLEHHEGTTDELMARLMATVKTQKRSVPTIIYASRTHSQLAQVMQELKNTTYSKKVTASIMGSREQLCINNLLTKEKLSNSAHIAMCRSLVKNSGCSFYHGVEKKKDFIQHEYPIADVEDLCKTGQKHHFCPYYMSRALGLDTDIIFMPYNYIFENFGAMGRYLNQSVIIIDEAHNVDSVCEDASSFTITTTDIAMCITELTRLMKSAENDANDFLYDTESKDFTDDDLVIVKSTFLDLEVVLNEMKINNSKTGDTFAGDYIFTLFEQAGIDQQKLRTISGMLEKICEFLSKSSRGNSTTGQNLQKFRDVILTMIDLSNNMEAVRDCFNVNINEETNYNKSKRQTKINEKKQKNINLWCFSPSYAMSNLLRKHNVRNIILTSGTLSPLDALITEMGIHVPIRLENPHIINNDQIMVKVLHRGYGNHELNSSFNNRSNPNYLTSLGKTLQWLSSVVPQGLLVFFPSYSVMDICVEFWQQTPLWGIINNKKRIFVEPRGKDSLQTVISDYYETIDKHNNAIFMAVCRGKVSEGLDFANQYGRSVVIIGLPFPPYYDPRVVCKKEYLKKIKARNPSFALHGERWYSLMAVRAVNQAIGRVIRHKRDWGGIFLLDTRFDNNNVKTELSKWVREKIKSAKTFGEMTQGVVMFFNNCETKYPIENNRLTIDELANDSKPIPKFAGSSFITIASELTNDLDKFRKNMPPRLATTSSFNESKSCSSGGSTENNSSSFPRSISECSSSKNTEPAKKFNLISTINSSNSIYDTPSSSTSSQKRQKISESKYASVNLNGNESANHTKPEDLMHRIRTALSQEKMIAFKAAIKSYRESKSVVGLIENFHDVFSDTPNATDILSGLTRFVNNEQKQTFLQYIQLRKTFETEQNPDDSYDLFLCSLKSGNN